MQMKLSTIILSIGFVVVLFVAMLVVKADAQSLVQQREALMQEREQLQKNLRVLHVEYAYLTRPDRLIQLSEKYNYVDLEPEKMEVIDLTVTN